MAIRVLPPQVAAKIAAGEVVERPASVVKELIENAIDAAATEIDVEFVRGGQRLIRVSDNGSGIPAAEVALAFARHSTSKLETAEDLQRIRTLGFRGEALASIAAVADVTLITRYTGEEVGTLIRLEGGEIVRQQGHGATPGTIVTVENLFRNTPARLKFLRGENTEAKHITDLVSKYALAYPEIRFRLTREGRVVLQTTGGSAYDVLVKVLGLQMAQQMLEVPPTEEDGVLVSGYVSAPTLTRSNTSYITFFVNRRWIQDRSLLWAVEQAYHSLMPVGQHPVAVVHIIVRPEDVDVNVHPTKREVRFRDARRVFAAVQRAVRRALVEGAPLPSVGAPLEQTTPVDWGRRRRPISLRPLSSREPGDVGQLGIEIQRTKDVSGEKAPRDEVWAPEPPIPFSLYLPALRVLGQLHRTYIVAEGPEGMYLIDQHAAHERVLYEKLSAEQAAHQVVRQTLLEPMLVELTPQQSMVMEENREALAALGFDLEPFGGDTYLLRAIPASLSKADITSALAEMLDEGEETPYLPRWQDRALATIVCHSAVRAGQVLSIEEMRDLVRQLEETALPYTCPHGRPTVIRLSSAQLERQFGRG